MNLLSWPNWELKLKLELWRNFKPSLKLNQKLGSTHRSSLVQLQNGPAFLLSIGVLIGLDRQLKQLERKHRESQERQPQQPKQPEGKQKELQERQQKQPEGKQKELLLKLLGLLGNKLRQPEGKQRELHTNKLGRQLRQ